MTDKHALVIDTSRQPSHSASLSTLSTTPGTGCSNTTLLWSAAPSNTFTPSSSQNVGTPRTPFTGSEWIISKIDEYLADLDVPARLGKSAKAPLKIDIKVVEESLPRPAPVLGTPEADAAELDYLSSPMFHKLFGREVAGNGCVWDAAPFPYSPGRESIYLEPGIGQGESRRPSLIHELLEESLKGPASSKQNKVSEMEPLPSITLQTDKGVGILATGGNETKVASSPDSSQSSTSTPDLSHSQSISHDSPPKTQSRPALHPVDASSSQTIAQPPTKASSLHVPAPAAPTNVPNSLTPPRRNLSRSASAGSLQRPTPQGSPSNTQSRSPTSTEIVEAVRRANKLKKLLGEEAPSHLHASPPATCASPSSKAYMMKPLPRLPGLERSNTAATMPPGAVLGSYKPRKSGGGSGKRCTASNAAKDGRPSTARDARCDCADCERLRKHGRDELVTFLRGGGSERSKGKEKKQDARPGTAGSIRGRWGG